MTRNSPPPPARRRRPRHDRATRIVFACLGGGLIAIGMIGAFLPILPSTVFFIAAAACFARSSPRLERWLLNHPRIGPAIRAWRANRAISVPAKIAAVAGMASGYLVFFLTVRPDVPLAAFLALVLMACAAYVLSRPSASPKG
ncbi:YbaN family protein [Stappia stellulata]|uniref:YbaN family protein n=1 Tax=Stappia stellulata TaxID=71235 RepID=UPI0009FD5E01|nr:YbaN family protein [Stappia stellulata]